MKVDDAYHYFLTRANIASGNQLKINTQRYYNYTKQYVDSWVEEIAKCIVQLNASGGVSLLNLPEA
jgi:hypothetical protein